MHRAPTTIVPKSMICEFFSACSHLNSLVFARSNSSTIRETWTMKSWYKWDEREWSFYSTATVDGSLIPTHCQMFTVQVSITVSSKHKPENQLSTIVRCSQFTFHPAWLPNPPHVRASVRQYNLAFEVFYFYFYFDFLRVWQWYVTNYGLCQWWKVNDEGDVKTKYRKTRYYFDEWRDGMRYNNYSLRNCSIIYWLNSSSFIISLAKSNKLQVYYLHSIRCAFMASRGKVCLCV